MEECKKIVRQLAFFAAIEVGDEPSAAEGLDVESIPIENDYDGVRIGNEMTQEFIDDMIERFKNGKKIHRKYVYQIIIAVKQIVYDEATMVEMKIPDDVELTVCGDTHGSSPLNFMAQERFGAIRHANDRKQDNTLILWSYSGETAHPATSTGTSSTATLSTEAHGRPKLHCCYMPTSGCALTVSS